MNLHERLTGALYDYLQPICADAGVADVVFDYDNGVEDDGDFVALDVRAVTSDSRPEVTYLLKGGDLNDEFVKYRGTVSIGVDIYSNNQAVFIAEQIKAGMWREKAHETAMKENIGLVGYGDTLNLSAIQDGKYRHRAQFDLSINFAFVYGLEDTTIGTVTVKGDIEDGKYLVEETITE